MLGSLCASYVCNLSHVGGASWVEYGHLIDESRLVHVTTLDFLCLTAFAPFWMLNDAEARNWEQRWAEVLCMQNVLHRAVLVAPNPNP